MSKIDEALSAIKQYLASDDQSEDPRIRNAAEIYAQACSEINLKLADCRKLIDNGLFAEAQKISGEMSPSLTDRAKKLLLSPAEFSHYRELCNLYGYAPAPVLDNITIEQLAQPTENKEEILRELVLRWRKIARTGSNPEKIKLLRQIIGYAPQDDQLWRSNLASVERQWVNDLLKEADSALKENDGEKIVKIYMALADPQLLKPVSQEVLDKLRPSVRKYQEELLACDLEKKRTELFAAYSAQDFALITEKLREYDMLITNPLYVKDADVENAVQEVRDYHQQQLNIRNTARFHQEKLAELTNLLDQHGDYVLIENAYAALQKTDIPLDKRLTQRLEVRREEYLQEISRKHTRKVIYSVLGAVIILLLAMFVFHVIQSTRTLFSYQKSMNTLMANGNYRGVLKLYDEIKAKNPVLLQFGKLSALRAEAEKAMANQQNTEQKIKDLLTRGEQLLRNRTPHLEELKRIQKALAGLQLKNMPAELAQQQQKMDFTIRRLEFTAQQQADREYIARQKESLKKLAEYRAMLNDSKVSLDDLQNRIADTMDFMQNLTENSLKTSENLRKSHNTIVQEQGKSLLRELKNIKFRRQLLNDLQAPKTFAQYCEVLKKLPSAAPDLATGVWRTQLKNIYETQSLAAGANLSACNSHTELEKAINDLQINISNNCFIRDITRMLPDKYFKVKYPDALTQLRSDLAALYNCYELTFTDQDNINWHFYSAEKPQTDKSRTSRIPKAIAISVMLLPGAEGKFLPLLVERSKGDNITFKTGKFTDLALPDKFVKLVNMPVTSPAFPKSKQYVMLEEALRSMQYCRDINQLPGVIAEQLNKIAKAENVNIFAQAYLLRRLLDIYALTSDFNRMAINRSCQELDEAAAHLYRKWYTPTVMAENPDAVKKLKAFFKKFSSEQLAVTAKTSEELYKQSLSRGLIPGGIVFYNSNGEPLLHWFSGMDSINELWFYNAATNDMPAGWMVLDKKNNVDSKNNSLINFGFTLHHGTVFFVPADGRNTAEMAKKIKADAARNKVHIISWPESWPLNKR